MRIGKGIASGWGFRNWKGTQPGRGLWGLKYQWWVLICVLYIVSPLDAIPDFIPVLGQMDDLGVLVFLLYNALQWLRGSGFWSAGSDAGLATRADPRAPMQDPIAARTYEVQVTDEAGVERWVAVAAQDPEEARRSVAASGRYRGVGRVRAQAA